MTSVHRGRSQPRLAELAHAVRSARTAVESARQGRPAQGAEGAARQCLLAALEAYVGELQQLHLPVPPRLATELRLIRSLGHRR